jgi:signal transduction histidine kinase
MPAKITAIKSLVDRAIEAVRNVASNLRPTALDMGLLAAIEWLGNDFSQRTGLVCHIHAPDPIEDIAEPIAVATFRVVQESLTNITRHAQATRVDISVTMQNGKLCVDIRDDGIGFAVATTKSKKTFGLLGMQERVLVHQGSVDIRSGPGQGTQIRIAMPMNNTVEGPLWEQ